MRCFRIISVFVCFCLPINVLAQQKGESIKNTVNNDCCIYRHWADYKTYLETVAKKNAEKLDKKYRKEYVEIINEKNKDLLTELKENNFLFDTVIRNYLSAVFNYILDKNGLDRNDFHFFINRTAMVNASAYEDGTVICNLGLLAAVETESQLAMVLCHELAHYLLNHVNNAVIKRIEKFNSPEFLAQIKEIKKEKYNTKKQLEELFVSDLFNRRRHNRSQEMAADSLGMLLLSKTGYGSTAVPQLYDLLDSAEMLSTKCSIQSFFKKENIAADDNWFITRKKMSFGAPEKKEIRDTLKTHPDCAARKINARQYFSKNPKPGADFIFATSSQFNKTREMASLAAATYSKDKEQLSYYLYQLIQNDAVFLPGNYIKTEIFSLWVNFYFRLKNHTLGYVIDKPYIPENEKDEYAKLLQMLDDIDLKKMKEIATSYYEKNKNYIAPDTELLTNYNLLKQSLK